MTGQEWVSVHVFYADDLDPLLVDVVAPLLRELTDQALIQGSFFLRYWDGGPHLRLRCRTDPDTRPAVEHLVTDRITRFLRDQPAGHQVDPREFAAYAAEMARKERVPDYLRRPHPTNTVALIPYRREHDRYGHGESMAAVERHFGQSSEIVLSWLVAGLRPPERLTAGLALMLLAWFCAGLDPATASRLAVWYAADSTVGTASPERYDHQREQVHQLATRMRSLAARSGELSGEGGLLDWARSVRSLHDTLTDTLDRTGGRTPSGVVDLCAHLACNRLGIGPDQERHLRLLAARAMAALDQNGR